MKPNSLSLKTLKHNPLNQRKLRLEPLEHRYVLNAAFPEFVDPNPSPSNGFGTRVVPLSTGNVVVTSPLDDAGGTNAGAVYLFNGETGDLISTLRGSSNSDLVGFSGIVELTNGNFLVKSPNWDSPSGVTDVGAMTFGNGVTGIEGVVSASNSLIGSSSGDQVGGAINGTGDFDDSILRLSNGNFVLRSPRWDNGTIVDAGAFTFGDGTVGVTGEINSLNSLVGNRRSTLATFMDEVGDSNYILRNPGYSSGSETNRGAITFGSGLTGISGTVSTSNSLIGRHGGDLLGGLNDTFILENGNYVGWSQFNGTGSFTFGNGNSGVTGIVSASNSLVGAANARVGSALHPVTPLANGNYVMTSYWENASGDRVHAFTFADGNSGIIGTSTSLTTANSLISPPDPDTQNRNVFDSRVVELENGNYVVTMPHLDLGSVTDAGAVTFADGAVGVTGLISAANSLVGTQPNDQVGESITPLVNGNYVIESLLGIEGSGLGAVTLADGTAGLAGALNLSTSLVGSSAGDNLGVRVESLPNGNFVASFSRWNNGAIANAGAVALGDGLTGISGVVSPANSLVGSSTNDFVGIDRLVPLSDGGFVIVSPFWDDSGLADVGAVTYSDGTTLSIGPISTTNSLVGSSADDQIGRSTTNRPSVHAVGSGGYVVGSPKWDSSSVTDVGAVTFAAPGGITGVLTPANSLVGTATGDRIGTSISVLENGNYVVASPDWDNASAQNAGAVTFGDGMSGIVGPVTTANSLVGSTADDAIGEQGVHELFEGNYVVASDSWDDGATIDAGSITFGNGISGVVGPVGAANSLLGTEGFALFFDSITDGDDPLVVRDDVNGYFSVRFQGPATQGVPFNYGGRVLVGSQTDGVALGSLQALLSGSELSITDTGHGFAGQDNNLTLSTNGTDLVVSDTVQTFQSAPAGGTLSPDGKTLTIPLASLTSIRLASRGGDDAITIDLSVGITSLPIAVDGENPFRDEPGDSLSFIGNSSTIATLTTNDTFDSGMIAVTEGATNTTIDFEGIDSLSLLETSLGGTLDVGDQDVTIDASFPVSLGMVTTIAGGTISSTNGLELLMGSSLEGNGTIIGNFVNQGDVVATDSGITFENTVSGAGSFSGDVTFLGGTQFGNSPTATAIDGNALFGETNTHEVELGGLVPGTEFDQVDTTGTVDLSGTLEIVFIDGYQPSFGDEFEIMLANLVLGEFDDLLLPELPGALQWVVEYQPTAVRLEITEPRLESNIVFVGDFPDGQTELYRSDGTNGSATGRLKNISGANSSAPHELTVVGEQLFFAATTFSGEVELFRMTQDGRAGRVKNIGPNSSNPHELTAFGGELFFAATASSGETELFKSDGTGAGTVRVKNLSGSASADPQDLTVLGNQLFFTAKDAAGDRELYVSDGTTAGTLRVRNLYGTSVSSDPSDLTVVGNTLYFVATTPSGERQLHKSDGSFAGTVVVNTLVNDVAALVEFAGEVFFAATGADGQQELWQSDGTEAGTVQVADLSGAASSSPHQLTPAGSQLFFSALTDTGESELHVYDGTTARLVANLHGTIDASPMELTAVEDLLYFTAIGNDLERELYTSDGVSAGRLKDIGGTISSNPSNLTAIGSELFFAATSSFGTELFSSDGTNAGTGLVKNLAGSPAPREIVEFQLATPLPTAVAFNTATRGPSQPPRLKALQIHLHSNLVDRIFADEDGDKSSK